jgi:hypothetical protein
MAQETRLVKAPRYVHWIFPVVATTQRLARIRLLRADGANAQREAKMLAKGVRAPADYWRSTPD